ncbi:WD domain protein [Leucoagaricus gongylophorus]
MDETSSEDETASQTTEDDLPENHPPSIPVPAIRPPPSQPIRVSRVKPPNYELRYTLRGHSMSISAVKFSPDGKLLASCGAEKFVKIWNPENGEFIRDLSGHTQGLSDIAWSSDSTFLASASDDTTIRIWNVELVYIPFLFSVDLSLISIVP